MHDICCVNLPRSASARLRKVSLQLPHLSVFSLIKRVFRDALNELDSCLKNKEEQEQNERIQQILEMFRKQLNEQTTAEYEEYKAKSRRDPNAFTIMFTDPLDDLDDPDEMND